MTTKREGFFGTDNLHRAGWTAAIAIAGFVGALVYQKVFGPQKVVIEALNQISPSVPNSIELSTRSKEITDLAKAINKLAEKTTGGSDSKRLTELLDEVDRLRAEVTQSRKQQSLPLQVTGEGSSATVTAGNGETKLTSVKFKLPDNIEGYTSTKIFGVSASSCPLSRIEPGMAVEATFKLVDSSLRSRATPLRVTIVKIRTPTDMLSIDEAWHELQDGVNKISLTPTLDSGSYQLTYGFYLRTNLSGKFPPFYSRECTFLVSKS
jgi:hypothetical protein